MDEADGFYFRLSLVSFLSWFFFSKLSFILQMTKVRIVRERNYPKRIDTVFKICEDYVTIEVTFITMKN